ncbi:MAG TPA: transglycosylase domain-containing protein, partial [Acidimicrobiales bacterium]|nr:transglycosylase domain-containing protein [Acidimicrobiales bacterium]
TWMVLRWALVVALIGAVVASGVLVASRTASDVGRNAATAGPPRPLTFSPLAQRSVVYAKDGSVLAELHAEEDRVSIPFERVPAHVVRAVLDAEDERFFEHGALDARALLRALVNNVDAGGVTEGGSTITQQLVKIELLTPEKDVNRKLKEAVLAVQLEEQFSKQEILQRYLNQVYFGNGAYGIQAAAQTYYGIDADELTLPQGVLLAGLIRYPGGSDPFAYPDAARDRRIAVADRMRFLNHITEEELGWIKSEALPTPPPTPEPRGSDYFAEKVKQELLAAPWLGETDQDRYHAVFKGGLHIHTTLDPRAQRLAQDAVERLVPEDPRGFAAALVSVEPGTGAVRALVGGDNFDAVKFNLVTDGDGRQTGSSAKMFTLMAALEAGMLPIDTIDGSAPCHIENPLAVDPIWSPSNVEGQAAGTLTLAQATVSSVNCAYARLIKIVGPDKVVDVARRLGVTNPIQPHLSITLGSEPVTPLQMATAYATLAADGMRNDPYFVQKVFGREGTLLWEHTPQPVRAVSAQHARMATAVMTQGVQAGTGTAAALPGRQVAGKTGSADDNADAWFVGYTHQLATAVWMGAPQGRVSMYNVGIFPRVYGGTYPAMIFGAFMREALAGQPAVGFPEPAPFTRGSNHLQAPIPSREAVAASNAARRAEGRNAPSLVGSEYNFPASPSSGSRSG